MRTSRLPVPGGFGLPLGFTAGIFVTTVAVAAGATSRPGWSVAALAVTVAGVSAVTTPAAALGTAAVCWCVHDGFVLGRRGDLVFTAASAEAAALLIATALAVVALAALVRRPSPGVRPRVRSG